MVSDIVTGLPKLTDKLLGAGKSTADNAAKLSDEALSALRTEKLRLLKSEFVRGSGDATAAQALIERHPRVFDDLLTEIDKAIEGQPADYASVLTKHGIETSDENAPLIRFSNGLTEHDFTKPPPAKASNTKNNITEAQNAAAREGRETDKRLSVLEDQTRKNGLWIEYRTGIIMASSLALPAIIATEYATDGALSSALGSITSIVANKVREHDEELANTIEEVGIDAALVAADLAGTPKDLVVNATATTLEQQGQTEAAMAFRIAATISSPVTVARIALITNDDEIENKGRAIIEFLAKESRVEHEDVGVWLYNNREAIAANPLITDDIKKAMYAEFPELAIVEKTLGPMGIPSPTASKPNPEDEYGAVAGAVYGALNGIADLVPFFGPENAAFFANIIQDIIDTFNGLLSNVFNGVTGVAANFIPGLGGLFGNARDSAAQAVDVPDSIVNALKEQAKQLETAPAQPSLP